VTFQFFAHVRIKITGVHVNFTIGVTILLGQRMEKFFNLAFARTDVHTGDVDWVYQ